MKQTIFPFLLLTVISLASCRKDKNYQTIKQYDQTQIQNYIAANGITGMIRDTSGGDTTGMYYKILTKGTGPVIGYPTQIRMVYTLRTLDGSYVSSDTISNHYYDYAGHIKSDNLPTGLQSIIVNVLKTAGTSMRVLIPSHLAYGVNGNGSGSSQVANNRISGNQSLDYYVHVIDKQPAYDDLVINNYMKANSLTGFSKDSSATLPGNVYYYKTVIAPTGTIGEINDNSTINCYYTTQLFNKVLVDSVYNGTNYALLPMDGLVEGVKDGIEKHAATGSKITLLIPSNLAYGLSTETSIPYYSCLRFDFVINSKTP